MGHTEIWGDKRKKEFLVFGLCFCHHAGGSGDGRYVTWVSIICVYITGGSGLWCSDVTWVRGAACVGERRRMEDGTGYEKGVRVCGVFLMVGLFCSCVCAY